MKTRFGALNFVVYLSVATAAESWAQRQYRCNGRVQYHPCHVELFKRREGPSMSADARARPAIPEPASTTFAAVTTQTYRRDGGLGWWRGTVEGNGRVHLHLQIFRRGVIESTRYMGNVTLAGKSTWFSFKGPLPDGHDWSWLVVASAS